ncbi:hypothetical protein [Pseudoduganella sp. GCM10020061]|uniref:hypothetical protein n=1 Tax=Pseudoduganella sp. GCM10020061 TaxID=3317345 RepID=UPI00363B34A4
MALFFGILIGLVIAAILIKSVAFRIVAGLLIAGAIVLIVFEQMETRKETEESLTRIKPSELQMSDVSLKPGYANSYRLSGRVVNRSPRHTLTGIAFTVKVEDCTMAPAAPTCVTIGEGSARIAPTVPPGHARDFDELVAFDKASPTVRGQMKWSYTIDSIHAR